MPGQTCVSHRRRSKIRISIDHRAEIAEYHLLEASRTNGNRLLPNHSFIFHVDKIFAPRNFSALVCCVSCRPGSPLRTVATPPNRVSVHCPYKALVIERRAPLEPRRLTPECGPLPAIVDTVRHGQFNSSFTIHWRYYTWQPRRQRRAARPLSHDSWRFTDLFRSLL